MSCACSIEAENKKKTIDKDFLNEIMV